jgi:hypothetical protein
VLQGYAFVEPGSRFPPENCVNALARISVRSFVLLFGLVASSLDAGAGQSALASNLVVALNWEPARPGVEFDGVSVLRNAGTSVCILRLGGRNPAKVTAKAGESMLIFGPFSIESAPKNAEVGRSAVPPGILPIGPAFGLTSPAAVPRTGSLLGSGQHITTGNDGAIRLRSLYDGKFFDLGPDRTFAVDEPCAVIWSDGDVRLQGSGPDAARICIDLAEENWRPRQEPATVSLGASPIPQGDRPLFLGASAPQNYLGLMLNPLWMEEERAWRLIVMVIDTGGPLGASGLVPGDRLLAAGAIEPVSPSGLRGALDALGPNRTFQLKVLRCGRVLDIQAHPRPRPEGLPFRVRLGSGVLVLHF